MGHNPHPWAVSPSCALSKAQALAEGLGLGPQCQMSALEAQPSLIPGGDKCDTFNGTLKFHGDDAYLMGLNKAFLKTAQTAPQGRGPAHGSQPKCSLICLRGTTWHSKLLLEPSAGPFVINININNINIMRMSEGLRGQGRNSGCLVPFQAAPSLRDRCGRPAPRPSTSPSIL